MSKPPISCAVYTRKSSEEGLEQSFNSLEAQREACVAYIQSQKHEGWTALKDAYGDGGYSGGNMERPGLARLLNDIRAGIVGVVVVYKVDRLTRSLSDFAKIIEVFDSHHVSFVSVTQQFNTTTSMGRLTLNVLLSFAQFERELTGERIRDKVAASKKKGMWMGGMVPLGYDCIDRQLVVNKLEAEAVRDIFRQYLRLGSVTKLKEYLELKGLRSKIRTSKEGRTFGGAVYSRGALHQILGNPVYLGKIVHQGHSYTGKHEPIVAQELWDEVSAHLKTNDQGKRAGKTCATPSLLTGILRDINGVPFTPTHTRKRGKRYRYYTSQAVIRKQGERPPIPRYPAGELEKLVVAEIHRMLGDLEAHRTKSDKSPQIELTVRRAANLAARWFELTRSHQEEVIRIFLKSVTLGQKHLWIEVDEAKLVSTLLGQPRAEPARSVKDTGRLIRLTSSFSPVRRGAELRILAPDYQTHGYKPNASLLRAIAHGRVWYERLVAAEVHGVKQLAKESRFKRRYVRKLLQTAVLSPEVTELILSGRQSHHLTAKRLYSRLPLDWVAQTLALTTRQPQSYVIRQLPRSQASNAKKVGRAF